MKLTRLVRGELDWIVMKCLEKERSRRYDTAVGLGRDLERYLADEQVVACPPTVRYRLRKFTRKHRASVLTFVAFMVLLLLRAVVSTMQASRARRAEARARENEMLARRAEEDASNAGRPSARLRRPPRTQGRNPSVRGTRLFAAHTCFRSTWPTESCTTANPVLLRISSTSVRRRCVTGNGDT